jgi:hypothetical protein
MFGQSKPVVFNPYGSRRPRRRVPRWLVLLLTGVVIGSGGLYFVQQRYLPPRLSAAESTRLRASFEDADSERLRLRGELADTAKRLEAALAERSTLGTQLTASRQTTEGLRRDLASLVAALPPDPRGGAVQVRAARFATEDGKLLYEIVLSRPRADAKPLTGVMQLVVGGAAARGSPVSIKLTPVAITLGSVESLRGGLPLPEGFDPRQATIHVLDRPDGKLLGMRVMNVK